MKALVTGGAGFIGSHLVDALVERGDSVWVLDDLSTGCKENVNKEASFIKGSILDYSLVSELTRGIDVVFHLAAWARVPRSIEDPLGTHAVNVSGMLNVLQACREHNVGRLVYSSSSSVYGDKKEPVMHEGMSTKPKSPYALHKLIGEQYSSLFAKLFNMSIVSLRYFNVYGKRQLTEGAYSLVIGKFLKQKAQGEKLTIYGEGEQTRAYTHVSDVVQANLLASLAELGVGNHIFNVGTNVETSVNKIAELIGGEREYIIPNPRGAFEEKRKCANFDKIKLALGWTPLVSIQEGIKGLQ